MVDSLKRQRLAALLLAGVVLSSTVASCSKKQPEPSSTSSSPSSVSSETNSTISEETGVTVPNPDYLAKIKEYKATNSDVKAWLAIDGIPVNDPVVQNASIQNNNYYLRLSWDRKYRFLGCFYADFRAKFGTGDDLSRNMVIYGHNVDDDKENGEMFAQLLRYENAEWYNEHPYIQFSTEYEDKVWVIFAAFYTSTQLEYNIPDPTDAQFMSIVSEAKERSELNTNIDVQLNDHILTLSTCSLNNYNRDDQRWVVMAREVREGEDIASINPTATQNPSPKKPF